ncbi:MAG: hypothetical protein ACLQBL_17070 [Polyangiaceae bacterium]
MSTRAKATKSVSHSTASTKAAHAVAATAAPVPANPAPVPSTPFIAPPPASANIPSPPSGFVPTNGANYKGMQPQKAELVALPLAITDLGNFTSYTTTLGSTAPPIADVLQTLDVTSDWSTMRNAAAAWDAYCRDQEGICWTTMRTLMDRLTPSFQLAVKGNPSLATTYAGLATLLGAKAVSAKKSVATRTKNKAEVAAGNAPTHGLVGKAHQKAAAKAALAAQNAQKAPGTTEPSAPVSAPVIASPVVEAPVVSAPATQPAVAAPANGVPVASNGASHS